MINLNINSYDNNINDLLIVWQRFGNVPNQLIINKTYDYNSFIQLGFTNINTNSELIFTNNEYISNDRILTMISESIFLSYIAIEEGNKYITDLIFFYKTENNKDEIFKLIEDLESISINIDYNYNSNLNILTINKSNLEIINIENDIDVNWKKFYSKSTAKNISSLINKLNKNKNKITIFYGERGTGKTSIIKNIASKINNKVFFIPNNILDQTIINPEFINFIRNYEDSVFIIDDFEGVLDNLRYNYYIDTIIQMVDSLMSDILNFNIILIFNRNDISDIDDILSCNNILEVISFDPLTLDESTELSEHLGIKSKFKNKSKLVDIINNNINKNNKRVGF